jgi:PPOX class probable F420-dependent enzyme
VNEAEMRGLVEQARVARLATVRDDGRIDLVPITFAVVGDVLYTAVDHKPKTTRQLRRLDNIRQFPGVSVLVDHYDDGDWSALWWVRLRGIARVSEAGAGLDRAVDALVDRYPQYRRHRPEGPAIVVDITDWTGWAAG